MPAKFAGTIRPLAAADRAQWNPLWQGYLTFYKSSLPADVTGTTFERLLDPDEPMFALVAEQDGRLIGIAHCVVHRSTWAKGMFVYLNDLFVSPDVRGSGAGRALIEATYAHARELGAERVHWLTHEKNDTARALYDRMAEYDGFIQYKHALKP